VIIALAATTAMDWNPIVRRRVLFNRFDRGLGNLVRIKEGPKIIDEDVRDGVRPLRTSDMLADARLQSSERETVLEGNE
jgi:hypothetical protein